MKSMPYQNGKLRVAWRGKQPRLEYSEEEGEDIEEDEDGEEEGAS